jgi:hypothetical protein
MLRRGEDSPESETSPAFTGLLHRVMTVKNRVQAMESASQEEREEDPGQNSAALEGLRALFHKAVEQRRKNSAMMGLAAALSAGFAVTNLFLVRHASGDKTLLWAAVGSLCLTLSLSFRGLFRLKEILNQLHNVSDLRMAGPLIEIAGVEEGGPKAMATLILTRLLARFRASDARLLNDAQYAVFLRVLSRNEGTAEFFVAALKALEQVGDVRALAVVENLAKGRRVTTDPHRVQAAAQDCLPFLQVRCDQQRASQTLLRASTAVGTPADILLRPAQGNGATEASELLRAGSSLPENP